MNIKFAEIQDLPKIVEIYNQAVEAGNATADIEKIAEKERLTWFEEHHKDSYPIYLLFSANKVAGWCSLSPYRKGRKALSQTAEVSYYIDYHYHRKGFGEKLLTHAIQDCYRLGIKNIFALLLENNLASIGLLTKLGFEKWGFMPHVANFNGNECGHLIYGLRIYE